MKLTEPHRTVKTDLILWHDNDVSDDSTVLCDKNKVVKIVK